MGKEDLTNDVASLIAAEWIEVLAFKPDIGAANGMCQIMREMERAGANEGTGEEVFPEDII